MAYGDNEDAVQLASSDLEQARRAAADVAAGVRALAAVMTRALNRADEPHEGDRIIGVQIKLPAAVPAQYTYCDYTTGECLYIYDDLTGVCRPCGPGDPGCTPHPHIEPQVLPL